MTYQTASKAKALFDFFYNYPLTREYRSYKTSLAEDLRLKLDELSVEEQDDFTGYIKGIFTYPPKKAYSSAIQLKL